MGMFDYIECEAPLPDGWTPKGPLQTKCLECEMATFAITSGGKLVQKTAGFYGSQPKDVPHHGTVHFYASNWGGSGCGLFYTHNDEPPWSKAYVAYFTNGQLDRIEGGDDDLFAKSEHVSRAEFDRLTEQRMAESLAKETSDKHGRAMELAAKADAEPDQVEASLLYREAAQLEASLARKTRNEPSMSVLYRSTASLYVSAGSASEALKEIGEWMGFGWRFIENQPPQEIANELADILEQIATDLRSGELHKRFAELRAKQFERARRDPSPAPSPV